MPDSALTSPPPPAWPAKAGLAHSGPMCNASVMQTKTFNARLAESDLKKFALKARRKGVSQTALLREWIHARDIPTAADAAAWEARNAGNARLRISRG